MISILKTVDPKNVQVTIKRFEVNFHHKNIVVEVSLDMINPPLPLGCVDLKIDETELRGELYAPGFTEYVENKINEIKPTLLAKIEAENILDKETIAKRMEAELNAVRGVVERTKKQEIFKSLITEFLSSDVVKYIHSKAIAEIWQTN